MRKFNIKKGDSVVLISGEAKGVVGTVKQVVHKKERVFIDSEQLTKKVKKHLKPDAANPDGGIIEKDFPFHISNVMLYDKKEKKASRIGRKEVKGKKVRYLKKSGETLS